MIENDKETIDQGTTHFEYNQNDTIVTPDQSQLIRCTCDTCGQTFANSWMKNIHTSHCRTCKFCKKIFTKRRLLRQHIIRKHNLRLQNLRCDLCQLGFGNMFALEIHFNMIHIPH